MTSTPSGPGSFVGVTNPKSIVFFAALLPQFVDPGAAAPQWAQLVILGMVFVLIALLGDSLWAVAAGSARAGSRARRSGWPGCAASVGCSSAGWASAWQ